MKTVLFIATFIYIVLNSLYCFAGQLYIWTDKNGVKCITKNPPPDYAKKKQEVLRYKKQKISKYSTYAPPYNTQQVKHESLNRILEEQKQKKAFQKYEKKQRTQSRRQQQDAMVKRHGKQRRAQQKYNDADERRKRKDRSNEETLRFIKSRLNH